MSKRLTSPVIKRSIVIAGRKTSVSLEEPFWNGLKFIKNERNREIAKDEEQITLGSLVSEVNGWRLATKHSNLSSAIRLHVLDFLAERAGLSNIMTEMEHG